MAQPGRAPYTPSTATVSTPAARSAQAAQHNYANPRHTPREPRPYTKGATRPPTNHTPDRGGQTEHHTCVPAHNNAPPTDLPMQRESNPRPPGHSSRLFPKRVVGASYSRGGPTSPEPFRHHSEWLHPGMRSQIILITPRKSFRGTQTAGQAQCSHQMTD